MELKVGQSHKLAAALQKPAKTPGVAPDKILELRKRLDRYKRASMIILGLMMIAYLPFCWSCRQLCRRAGFPSWFWIWLPLLKRIALFKVTDVSRLWLFLGFIIPIVGCVAWIVCCIRLCQLYQQCKWWTVLMIIPILGWPVFMYFPWASRAEDNDPAVLRASQGYAL